MENNFWRGKKIFITGANGFIGSWLARLLIEKRAIVYALIKEAIPFSLMNSKRHKLEKIFKGDITDFILINNIFKKIQPKVCFHLAAQPIVIKANNSPLDTFESNIQGTWNILEASRLNNLRCLIVASSVYKEYNKSGATTDLIPPALHPYHASKACCDILAKTYNTTYGLPLAITRFCNIYGEGDFNFTRIIPYTIKAVLENKNPTIRSDGTPLRDYIYIEDAVNAYLTLGEHVEEAGINGQVFNFGTERPISVLALVNKIIRLSGKKQLKAIILSKGKIKDEIDRQYLDCSKSRKLLDWQPKYTLERGLIKTIKWYKRCFK